MDVLKAHTFVISYAVIRAAAEHSHSKQRLSLCRNHYASFWFSYTNALMPILAYVGIVNYSQDPFEMS